MYFRASHAKKYLKSNLNIAEVKINGRLLSLREWDFDA
jgi:hypothetical protein